MTICKNNSKRFRTISIKKNNGLIFNSKSIKNLSNKNNPKPALKRTEKSGNYSLNNQVILNLS